MNPTSHSMSAGIGSSRFATLMSKRGIENTQQRDFRKWTATATAFCFFLFLFLYFLPQSPTSLCSLAYHSNPLSIPHVQVGIVPLFTVWWTQTDRMYSIINKSPFKQLIRASDHSWPSIPLKQLTNERLQLADFTHLSSGIFSVLTRAQPCSVKRNKPVTSSRLALVKM